MPIASRGAALNAQACTPPVAPPPVPEPTTLDPQALAKLAELDPTGRTKLVERVLRTFLGSVARLRPQFDVGWRDQDLKAVRLVAHTLKSSSASIGALQLSETCAAIENAIRLGHHESLPALVASAGAVFDGAVAAIERLLRETGS